jgi:hypothetical protein
VSFWRRERQRERVSERERERIGEGSGQHKYSKARQQEWECNIENRDASYMISHVGASSCLAIASFIFEMRVDHRVLTASIQMRAGVTLSSGREAAQDLHVAAANCKSQKAQQTDKQEMAYQKTCTRDQKWVRQGRSDHTYTT